LAVFGVLEFDSDDTELKAGDQMPDRAAEIDRLRDFDPPAPRAGA
jgi:hypothetical protein